MLREDSTIFTQVHTRYTHFYGELSDLFLDTGDQNYKFSNQTGRHRCNGLVATGRQDAMTDDFVLSVIEGLKTLQHLAI